MVKIFISHSEKDKEYAEKFIDFLRLGLEIKRADIFCSSYSGCNIIKGEDFVKYIKEKLDNTDIVFALISYNFIQSAFCIAELGASWNAGKTVMPIMLDENIKYSKVTALFEHISASQVNDKNDLLNIAEVIKKENPDINIPNLNSNVDKFIADIIMLQGVPQEPSVIDYEEYKKKTEEINKLKSIIDSLKINIQEKNKEIEELKQLKDREEVKKYEMKINQDFIEEFKQKCQDFTAALAKYPRFVQYMIYRNICNEGITYKDVNANNLNGEVKNALEKKLIYEEENGYVFDATNIKTQKIRNIVDDFQRYINTVREEVINYVANEYELEIDLGDKDFWEKCLNIPFYY